MCIKGSFIDWTAWHTNTEAARVSVLKRILNGPTTDSRHIFLVGVRVEIFLAEGRTVARTKDLESSPKLENRDVSVRRAPTDVHGVHDGVDYDECIGV